MKKVYAVLGALLLILMLVVGIYSLFSLNADVQKPELTFSGLLSGSYASGTRSYSAEAFPQSEPLKKMNTSLNGFYKFSGFSAEDDVQLILNMNSQAADHGASLENPSTAASSSNGSDSSQSTEPTEPTQPETT